MKQYYLIFLLGIFLNNDCLYAGKFDYKGDCIYHPGSEGLEECLDKELEAYDKILNTLYKKFYIKPIGDKLKKTEHLWIKFKEADCDYMASEVNEGKEYSYIYKACLINRTKERINDLKRSYFFFGWFRGRV